MSYKTPGLYQIVEVAVPTLPLRTGVPAFLGYTADTDLLGKAIAVNTAILLTAWSQYGPKLGSPLSIGYLAHAVRGFFENGGDLCYVVRLAATRADLAALRDGLAALELLDAIDLVCAPDIMRPGVEEADRLAQQTALLEHCRRCGNRLTILDSWPLCAPVDVQRQRFALGAANPPGEHYPSATANGALYYPWITVPDGPAETGGGVPPCGHVAGVFARSDQHTGVYKAPANEVLEGALDLKTLLTDAEQGELNAAQVNCLRAFPGRGLRVWGARTLSTEPAWTYLNVRRLFLTAVRWIDRNLSSLVFEPNNPQLWARIERDLTTYFNDLFQRGALIGRTAQEAFYVHCNAATNPLELRDAGQIVTEIGLAPATPTEFIVVRITQGVGGATITGPLRPA